MNSQSAKGKATQRRNGANNGRKAKKSPQPILDALIMEAMTAPRGDFVSTDHVARELGITADERAAARARIAQWEPDSLEDAPSPATARSA